LAASPSVLSGGGEWSVDGENHGVGDDGNGGDVGGGREGGGKGGKGEEGGRGGGGEGGRGRRTALAAVRVEAAAPACVG
jgi:hypothetical protein